MRPSTTVRLLRQLLNTSPTAKKIPKSLSHGIQFRNFSVSTRCDMRFVQYKLKKGGPQQLGAQIACNGDIFDLSAVDSSIPNSLVRFLECGTDMYEKAKRIVASGKSVTSLEEVQLLPPITQPDKVACVGFNYKAYCAEINIPLPTEPTIFSKFSSVITGPYDNIELPAVTEQTDYEAELVVVIGKKAKNLMPTEVNDIIFGYTIAQDLTARDWTKQRNNGQMLLGKTMDTFCPLGPCVVTKNKIDVNNAKIKCWVNGCLRQDGHTSDMVFKINHLLSHLSSIVTLYPGDLFLTGTPAGVGNNLKPPQFLKKGDVLETEIEGIGRMRNVCC